MAKKVITEEGEVSAIDKMYAKYKKTEQIIALFFYFIDIISCLFLPG